MSILKQPAAVPNESSSRRKIPAGVRISACLSLPFYPLLCLLITEYFNRKALFPEDRAFEKLLEQLAQFGSQFRFSVLVVYTLFILLILLFRRIWIAASVMGLTALLCGFINYMKIRLHSVPFIPADISLIGQARELASFISIPIPPLFWFAVIAVIFWSAWIAAAGIRLPGKWYTSVPVSVILTAAIFVAFTNDSFSTNFLSRFHMTIFDNALQVSNYTANGFVGGFTLNAIGMHTSAPENYSRNSIDAILDGYTPVESDPDAENFDVILVLSESFFDLRQLSGVTYSENPLPNYDSMLQSDHCYSGNLYTVAIGGGTVNTEFRVLTGLNTDYLFPSGATPYNYVKDSIEGYVSNYQSAGYHTIGLHLYNPNFYSRKSSYPHLGFDSFYSLEDYEQAFPVDYTRGYATDATTEQAIEHYLEDASQDGQPTFLFAITIENHQPYGENEDNTITATENVLSETAHQALTTYAQGAKDADAMLGALRKYIDARERPTILVWFGDHLPTLGETHTPYYALNYYQSDHSTEMLMQKYHTPFLVYANRELDPAAFPSKTDNQISDIYLMECVASATGFQQTAYMQYLSQTMKTLPICSAVLAMDDSLSPHQQEIVKSWQLIAYDRILGKRYSVRE